jgi:hypothetical protein
MLRVLGTSYLRMENELRRPRGGTKHQNEGASNNAMWQAIKRMMQSLTFADNDVSTYSERSELAGWLEWQTWTHGRIFWCLVMAGDGTGSISREDGMDSWRNGRAGEIVHGPRDSQSPDYLVKSATNVRGFRAFLRIGAAHAPGSSVHAVNLLKCIPEI